MLGPFPLFLIAQPASPAPVLPVASTPTQIAGQPTRIQPVPLGIAAAETLSLAPELLNSSGTVKPSQSMLSVQTPSTQTSEASPVQPEAVWRQGQLTDLQIYSAVELDSTAILSNVAGVDLVAKLAESGLQVPPDRVIPATAPLPNVQQINAQQIIDKTLAEMAELPDAAGLSQLQSRLISAAVALAKQGEFEKARQVIQHQAVPEALQTDVLNQISTLETEYNRQRVAQAAEQIRLANQARQLGKTVSVAGRGVGGLSTINVGPLSVTNRGLSYVGTMPAISKDYYRRVLQFPGKLGKNVLMFPLPVPAPITSGVGWRSHPVLGDRRFHSGTDIGAPEGTPILAVADGKVTGADSMGGYGMAVVIEHNNGTLETLYGHMSEILVRPGEWVQQGTVIGRVGSTGLSTGPHLHFEAKQLTSEGWVLVDAGPQLEIAQAQLAQVLQGGSLQLQATPLGQTFIGAAGGAQATDEIQALPEIVVPRVLAQALPLSSPRIDPGPALSPSR